MELKIRFNMNKRMIGFSLAVVLARTVMGFTYPTMGVAKWTAYMMGVDTNAKLAEVKDAVRGRSVKVAIANSPVGSKPNYEHDDYMESEMSQIADYLGLPLQIVRIQPEERSIKAIYEAAVSAGDIVVDYRSYWDTATISQITGVIEANPNKLFVLPYGEINGQSCPPTSTSLQGQAQHADGTGLPNLINTIPLAYSYGGNLMRPLRRDSADTSTITFVSPSAWASSIGETCPSAASASVVAAYVYAVLGNNPSAQEILRIMIAGSGYPAATTDTLVAFTESDLLKLKSELAEMTVTDGLGRKMLLHDKVLNLKGALDVIKTETSGIYARDSFENYAVGTEPSAMEGWSGDGNVVAESYSPPIPPGYPMTNVAHTMVFKVEGAAKMFPEAMAGKGRMDAMVCPARWRGEVATPPDEFLAGIACDKDGHLLLWHSYLESGVWKRGWTCLSERTYADGEWIRIGLVYDYTSNRDGDAFVQVKINGSCQVTARGVKSPQDPAPYGSWHYLAKNRHLGAVTVPREIQLEGAKVDDLLLCEMSFEPAQSGPTATNGINFAWFDANGLPRDPNAAAPFIAGYTLGDVHDAGVDPYSDRPLELRDMEVDSDGMVRILFNGYKGEDPGIGYRMRWSSTPNVTETSDVATGVFKGDPTTKTTTWEFDSTQETDEARFFRIEGVRAK